MSALRKYILFLFIFMFAFLRNSAQIVKGTNRTITAHFLNSKIETKSNSSIFNLLIIKNTANRDFSGTVTFSIPNNWNLLGNNNFKITVSARDSITLPVRISVAKDVVGEIGYALIASIYNNNEQLVLSEYCFIVIPRISKINAKLLDRSVYFDTKTSKANVSYLIENKGNINEVVQLSADGKNELIIENSSQKGVFVKDISIPPHSDTIINFSLKYDPNDVLKKYYFLDIKIYNSDTLINSIVWANLIQSRYFYEIPEYAKCGIFQIIFNNLLLDNPSISFLAKGNILFKKNLTLYYYLRPPTWSSYKEDYILWDANAMYYVGLKNQNFDIKLGNLSNLLRQRFYGLGGSFNAQLKKLSVGGFYVENSHFFSNYYGGALGYKISQNSNIQVGFGQMNFYNYNQNLNIATFGSRFNIAKNSNVYMLIGASQTYDGLNTYYEEYNYGLHLRYSGKYNKFKVNLSSDYGTPQYSGVSAGRFYINSSINYSINKRSYLSLAYTKQDYSPANYSFGILQPIRYTKYDKTKLEYSNTYTKQANFFYGAFHIYESTDQMIAPSGLNEPFSTNNYRIFFKALIRTKHNKLSIVPQIDIGRINIIEGYDYPNLPNLNTTTYNFYFNITTKNSGLLFFYKNGPFQIYEQYYFYINNIYYKNLSVTGFYNKSLFDNVLLLNLSGNYQSMITNNTNLLNLSARFTWFLPYDWSVYILGNYSLRTIQDRRTKSLLKYSSNYMEIGIRKDLNCNQPRVKFHNLKVYFFRDLNGNRIKESNEPGINGVLVNIKIDPDNIVEESASQFVSTELMSNVFGMIEYDNIPNGNYILNYKLIGNIIGNFSRKNIQLNLSINDDKVIYIPYLENNRIIGKVILNRDPLSALGNIKLGNIRVVAEDTKGNTYSALTDDQGNFVIYTPIADHYVVRINNVFYESFDLQQPEFIVKFNGYKQFEVTFVFNEKKRKINFDNQITEEPNIEDIKLIRKTTLTGKIRHTSTLEPVEAKIKIINNKTNKVVARAISNKITGNYSITYVAGPNYRMEVIANGYREHVENLYIEQVISIQNINKDIMLNKLSENPEDQKTYILYKKAEEEFTQEFKAGQIIPLNLNFNQRQTNITPDVYPELDRLIELLNKNKSVKIEIAGYADDQTNDRVENILALRRAKSVARYLTTHGINENRISVKSYGNTRPLVPGANEKARKKNRRVEIIVK